MRVAVVGAGVCGLATARALQDLGVRDLVVLDARHPGAGSSGLSVGMVETQYLSEADIAVRAYGRRYYDAMESEHGLRFVRDGYLRTAHDASDVASYEASVQRQLACGVPDAEVLTSAEIARRWPQLLVGDLAGGLFGPSDGHIDGYEFCALTARLIRDGGGRVLTGTSLVDARVDPSGWRLVTEGGDVEADVVVNAAGPWAGVVGELLGAPVPLVPQLHGAVVIQLAQPVNRPLPFVMDYLPGSARSGVYFRPERPDQLIAGLHVEEVVADAVSPDVTLGRVPASVVEELVDRLTERLRVTDGAAVTHSWTGIYPMTPDHRPIVGRHPLRDDVVCAVGAGGNGIQLAPAIGRVAAEAVLGTPTRTFLDRDPHWEATRLTQPALGSPLHHS
ncbi:MAG: Sarcosine oxidase subunit beta [Blastococcus sp.]|jgi:sarcosine oxidase subunit beta|nr:Sarcosine oxidase subunit beta [Blastococcus sp.]